MSQGEWAWNPAGTVARSACAGVLAAACSLALAHDRVAPADAAWQHGLSWRGQSVVMSEQGQGYALTGSALPRTIDAQAMRSHSASPLFDGLFALAQAELQQAQVESITDSAFDKGRPIACPCFETGEKWRYVWTRDVSYAADLALARVSPERTRASLRFKLSGTRPPAAAGGFFVAQDTGSGGSWPISSDRIVWFLAARHLIDDGSADGKRFADETWRALTDTLAQDRSFVFDESVGLYRGETSFLDWREQSYPRWTANDVGFIAQSFALSTNVLQYQALRLGEQMATRRGDARAVTYARQAEALAKAIDRAFWREDRGLYMSYIGTAEHRVPFEAYDLLGLALAIESGVAPPERARRALSRYPMLESGSPVIWPQQPDTAIYHNRAIWPFVSAYSLRAARTVGHAPRIAHEIRSLMRGAALAGSNMENYELVTQAVHVEDGALSGPVVNSPRQLWSVAAYLDMVIEGVFGVGEDGSVKPMLPTELVPTLFGDRDEITLQLPGRKVTLRRPRTIDGDLLVAGATRIDGIDGADTVVDLVATRSAPATLATNAAAFAPASPEAPQVREGDTQRQVTLAPGTRLYVDGKRSADGAGASPTTVTLARQPYQQCISLTRVGADGLESLHSPSRCVGDEVEVSGGWPRRWTAASGGRYSVRLDFLNTHGPINTGITAAVKTLVVDCAGQPQQTGTLVMPHGQARQRSSAVVFEANAGTSCRFELRDGFNMSYLAHFAHYTGGTGGASGALNAAEVGALHLTALPPTAQPVIPAKAGTQ
ncbi:MAG TPA: Six-hairpin glycosidase-like protein [Lysobacter sp.]